MAKTSVITRHSHVDKKQLLLLVVVALFLLVLLQHVGNLHASLTALRTGDKRWLLLSVAGLVASYAVAAMTYMLLAKKPLRYLPTVAVQIASMFTNRLLPAGVGAIGISYAYLKRQKHRSDDAAAVVAVNNLLGLLGHLTLLVLFIVFAHRQLRPPTLPDQKQISVTVGIVILVALGLYILLRSRRKKAVSFFRKTVADIRAYKKRPVRVLAALGSSMVLTSCYVLILYCSMRAFGVQLPLADVFVVLTFGVAGATVVPTPGGLGGAEASIVGGFVLYGLSASSALVIVLLYRLLTYWLALVVGAGAFWFVSRKRYI